MTAARRSGGLAVALFFVTACPPARLSAQRLWRPEDRQLISDLHTVTAVAATRQVVYAATLGGLASYDRITGAWRETIGPVDGLPQVIITAMAADPSDDTAWMAASGRWISWQPFGRRLESGPLPGGGVRDVILDASNPSSGAWFSTMAGWYFVPRGGFSAQPMPPPRSVLPGQIGPGELERNIPAFNVVRARIETDENMRRYRITSATRVPVSSELYIGTDGNGVFQLDLATVVPRRLSPGIAGGRIGAIGAWRGYVCAGAMGSVRVNPRSGVSCFDESVRDVTVYEDRRALRFPGSEINRVLVAERAIWTATNAGLVRSDRGGRETDVVTVRDGLPADDVHALAVARDGIWAGTSRGLARVSDTARAIAVAPIASRQPVLALIELNDTVWAGTAAGLALLPPLGQALEPATAAGPVNEPVVGIAAAGDTILAITPLRLLLRSGGEWRTLERPGRSIGVMLSLAADAAGFWIGGTEGLALFNPGRGSWEVWDRFDVPVPVRDIAVTRGYVWVASDAGVVRFARRALVQ